MKRLGHAIGAGLAAAATVLTLGAGLAVPAAPAAAMPVFDATNYAQNLLQAARALEQVNNQIASLQNEATMIQHMARNLERIDFPQLEQIRSTMQRINGLMDQAQNIDFKVDRLDQRIRTLFPGVLEKAVSRDQRVSQARARLDAAIAGYRQAMTVQAGVAESVKADAGTLAELAAASQGAVGALQAQQAANQLMALSVKQQLLLENLMASEFRDSALERARRSQAEADGRSATLRFIAGGRSN